MTKEQDAKKARLLRLEGAEYARKKVRQDWADSTLYDLSAKLPAFGDDEVKLGNALGRGAFGIVHEVKAFAIDPALRDAEANHPEAREFLSAHCRREDGGKDARYAVKMLSRSVIDDPSAYVQAIMDMAVETRILSNLDDHPNICKLRAVSASRDPYSEGYALVLDRLYDTLASRIDRWARTHKRCVGKMTKWLVDRGGKKVTALRENQLASAMDLCAALDYLHQRRIIYRDLKPENVGFDIRDDVKLFDFGLAKELRRAYKLDDDSGMYKLTEMTGSPRFMAPEVANGEPYNEKCDSHSFGILFWQMYSMSTPFEIYTMKTFRQRVWNEPYKRPYVQPKWPASIRRIMENSWCPEPAERWSISKILAALHAECSKLIDGPESIPVESQSENLEYNTGDPASMDSLRSALMRRRSTHVFGGPAHPTRRRSSAVRSAGETPVVSSLKRTSMLDQLRSSQNRPLIEFDFDEDDPDETEKSNSVSEGPMMTAIPVR